MIKAAIIGATGYTGVELVRLLSRHPQVQIGALAAHTQAGQPYGEIFPHLVSARQQVCVSQENLDEIVAENDVIFTALPHGHSFPVAEKVIKGGKRMVDLGADFRFDDYRVYEEWYGIKHPSEELKPYTVYGLPELYRERIRAAKLVANPGCYVTSIILGLAPALREKIIDPNTIVIDSKSGVSGAGRGASVNTLYSECNESIKAYNIGCHRHTPEIEQELSKLYGAPVTVTFTPHLTPMTRGILSTIYARLEKNLPAAGIIDLYREFYRKEPFVHVLPEGVYPQTKYAQGSNFCFIGIAVDKRTGRLVITSALDNLVKGASGQAVQNMNIMFGLPETTGLEQLGLYP